MLSEAETYWISCCELAALHQAVKGGFEDHVLSWDFFLLHSLCWQLLEELSNTSTQRQHEAALTARITVENSAGSSLLETNLHAGLLRGSGWDLRVVMGLRGLHWETHDRRRDGRRWSVVIRDLLTHQRTTGLFIQSSGFLHH